MLAASRSFASACAHAVCPPVLNALRSNLQEYSRYVRRVGHGDSLRLEALEFHTETRAIQEMHMSYAMEDWSRLHRITVDEFHRMAEVGLLDPVARVELIEGVIIDMAKIGPPHAAVVDRL